MRRKTPTNRDLARELRRAGAVEAPARRGKGSHKKFNLGRHTIVVPWKHPGQDASIGVVHNVRRFINTHGED